MGLRYFGGKSWGEVTREERVFCAVLWQYLRQDPMPFLERLRQSVLPNLVTQGHWEAGFEVCLYRDVRKMQGLPMRDSGFSQKRTFDIVLFGDTRIIIVEAKAQQGFEEKQAASFEIDADSVQRLLGATSPQVDLIALTGSQYSGSKRRDATSRGSRFFEGRIVTWNDVYTLYPDPFFSRADEIYGK